MADTDPRAREVAALYEINEALREQLAERAEGAERLDDLERLFELQQTRMRDATRRWQEATSQPDTFPDLGALLQWLMDERDVNSAEPQRAPSFWSTTKAELVQKVVALAKSCSSDSSREYRTGFGNALTLVETVISELPDQPWRCYVAELDDEIGGGRQPIAAAPTLRNLVAGLMESGYPRPPGRICFLRVDGGSPGRLVHVNHSRLVHDGEWLPAEDIADD